MELVGAVPNDLSVQFTDVTGLARLLHSSSEATKVSFLFRSAIALQSNLAKRPDLSFAPEAFRRAAEVFLA